MNPWSHLTLTDRDPRRMSARARDMTLDRAGGAQKGPHATCARSSPHKRHNRATPLTHISLEQGAVESSRTAERNRRDDLNNSGPACSSQLCRPLASAAPPEGFIRTRQLLLSGLTEGCGVSTQVAEDLAESQITLRGGAGLGQRCSCVFRGDGDRRGGRGRGRVDRHGRRVAAALAG